MFQKNIKKKILGFLKKSLKKYFPVENVIDGLFKLVKSLYGINVIIKKNERCLASRC